VTANLERKYGLDKPVWEQYVLYVAHAVRGDLGISFTYQDRNVRDIILSGMPITGRLAALALALVAAWTAYQPVRSVHAGDAALARLDQGAFGPAVSIAQIAVERNPLSVDPLFELAAIQQARGHTPEAERALERAVQVQPASAEAWRRLGRLRLTALSQPRKALEDFRAAYYLDPQNPQSWSDLVVATRAVKAG
jgi:tetratricopeptide (TPR) repeat protein